MWSRIKRANGQRLRKEDRYYGGNNQGKNSNQKNTDGVVLVGETRVPLDTVILHFKEGVSIEKIAGWYPTLELADVYFVIGYYLKNRVEIESYLQEREGIKKRVRKMVEARSNMKDLRKRLLARRNWISTPQDA